MLKPQQEDGFVPVESPVFGKPWYWQRTASSAESTRSLAYVIMEMRGEMKRLEEENRALRAGPGQPALGAEPGEEADPVARQNTGGAEEDNLHCLRRNVSAPALEGQFKETIAMTVRRYSFLPDRTPGAGGCHRGGHWGGHGPSSWGRLQQEVHRRSSNAPGSSSPNVTSARAEENTSNRLSLQEYMHKNRVKVKTVSFLLPVDDIYTSRPVLAKHHAPHNPYQLDAIVETDS